MTSNTVFGIPLRGRVLMPARLKKREQRSVRADSVTANLMHRWISLQVRWLETKKHTFLKLLLESLVILFACLIFKKKRIKKWDCIKKGCSRKIDINNAHPLLEVVFNFTTWQMLTNRLFREISSKVLIRSRWVGSISNKRSCFKFIKQF